MRVLDAPGCYKHAVRAERKPTLKGTGLVKTVGTCTQRRVALMRRAVATARDALWNDQRESAVRFERPAKQVFGASHRASSEARGEVCSLSYLSVVR